MKFSSSKLIYLKTNFCGHVQTNTHMMHCLSSSYFHARLSLFLTDAYKCDDMDISPGSTPTEESMLEKHASATKTSNAVAITGTPVSTPLEQPGSVTPLASLTPTLLSSASAADKSGAGTSSSTSVTNATVLSTLAALQQAVSQITVDKAPGLAAGGSVQQQQPQAASLISCLALLPPLISQLSMDKSANSQMRPQDRQQNALIMKQGIDYYWASYSWGLTKSTDIARETFGEVWFYGASLKLDIFVCYFRPF